MAQTFSEILIGLDETKRQILYWFLKESLTNKALAEKLSYSPENISYHKNKIYQKFAKLARNNHDHHDRNWLVLIFAEYNPGLLSNLDRLLDYKGREIELNRRKISGISKRLLTHIERDSENNSQFQAISKIELNFIKDSNNDLLNKVKKIVFQFEKVFDKYYFLQKTFLLVEPNNNRVLDISFVFQENSKKIIETYKDLSAILSLEDFVAEHVNLLLNSDYNISIRDRRN